MARNYPDYGCIHAPSEGGVLTKNEDMGFNSRLWSLPGN